MYLFAEMKLQLYLYPLDLEKKIWGGCLAWSQLDHGVDALGFWGRRRQDQLPEQEGDDFLVGLHKSIQKEKVMYTSGLLREAIH